MSSLQNTHTPAGVLSALHNARPLPANRCLYCIASTHMAAVKPQMAKWPCRCYLVVIIKTELADRSEQNDQKSVCDGSCTAAKITALNDCILTLTDVARTDSGIQFKWLNTNPGEYPTYVHIGNLPVIGAEGILYGFYETPDIASVPVTGAGKTAEWTTDVAVPKDAKGVYILLSVESGKQRLYANYVVDITTQ